MLLCFVPGGGKRTFVHISAETGATEAEEVGVEHLLRDINARQNFCGTNTFFRSNALRCTATARILILAQCSAVP